MYRLKNKKGLSDVRSEPVTFSLEASHLKPSIINPDKHEQRENQPRQARYKVSLLTFSHIFEFWVILLGCFAS
jgi:hypothetical protein